MIVYNCVNKCNPTNADYNNYYHSDQVDHAMLLKELVITFLFFRCCNFSTRINPTITERPKAEAPNGT